LVKNKQINLKSLIVIQVSSETMRGRSPTPSHEQSSGSQRPRFLLGTRNASWRFWGPGTHLRTTLTTEWRPKNLPVAPQCICS